MKKIVLLFAVFVVFTACSDDSTPPPTPPPDPSEQYFGDIAKAGNYWIYDNIFIDTNNAISNFTELDSLTCVKDSVFEGKSAKYVYHKVYDCADQSHSEANYFMYENGGEVYVSGGFAKIFMPKLLYSLFGDVFSNSQWIKIADTKSDSWTLDSIKLDNFPLPLGNFDVKFTGFVKLNVEKGKDTTLNLPVGNITANNFSLKIKLDGTGTVLVTDTPIPLQLSSDITKINLYLQKDKGLLGMHAEVTSLRITGILSMKFPGFKKFLVRTNAY